MATTLNAISNTQPTDTTLATASRERQKSLLLRA